MADENWIDLSPGAELPLSLRALFFTTAEETRDAYTCALDTLAGRYNHDPVWLYTLPASRNPIVSNIFHYIVTINTLRKAQQTTKFSEFRTASTAHKVILDDVFPHIKTTIDHKNNYKNIFINFFSASYNLARSIYTLAIVKLKFKKNNNHNNTQTLVDTFHIYGSISYGNYYPKLKNLLTQAESECVSFFPTLARVKISNIKKHLLEIYKNNPDYILKEQYLSCKDILTAWGRAIKGQRLPVEPILCCGIDISSLIQEELRSFKEFGAAFSGHLTQIALTRCAEAGIRPHTVVDWYENQPGDRGWNLGAKQAFPDALRIGYQAFPIASLHLNLIPSKAEQTAGMTPDIICPLGLYAETMKKACPDIAIQRAPSFRFMHLFDTPQRDADSPLTFDILCPLPLGETDALQLIELLNTLVHQIPGIRIAVLPHPAAAQSVKDAVSSADALEVPNASFATIVTNSRIVLGSASSTCLEALLKGVYVIIVATRGLLMNPIPPTVPDDMYHVSFSYEDVAHHVRHVLSTPPQQNDPRTRALLHACMTPVTAETVRSFLRLPPPHPQASDL